MRSSTSLTIIALAFAVASPAGRVAADDPANGATTFITYESYLSPAQQPGEEDEIPKPLVKSLGNTKPSTPRAQRKSRGWGRVRFAKDMTKAFIDVEIKGIADPSDIIMFHIHCGPPGLLGPILVDIGKKAGDLSTVLKGGKLSIEITNDDLTWASMFPPKGIPKAIMPPETCPVEPGWPLTTKTIVGMEYLARKGLLYFNLHTKQHTYYGEMRGQLYLSN